MSLSGAQKLIKFFSSKSKFEKMMLESKEWKFNCECGKTSSVWDAGGIRYKASGKPTVSLRCPACGKVKLQTLYREQGS